MWHVIGTEGTDTSSAQRGFTLLEILVALAVFSIAAAIAYKGLDAVIASKQAMEREIRFWRETGLVFERMETDFMQIVPRAFQNTPNRFQPVLQGEVSERGGFQVELSRSDGERTPLRIAYQCDNGELTMRLLPINHLVKRTVQTTQEQSPGQTGQTGQNTAHVLLRGVERCELAYLGANNAWLSAWPGQEKRVKPLGIRVRLTLAGRGTFERLFYLP